MPQVTDSLVLFSALNIEALGQIPLGQALDSGAGPNSAGSDVNVPAGPDVATDSNVPGHDQAVVASPPDVYHVVDVGRQPGLFINLPELVDQNIHKVPGGRAKKYATEEAAWHAFLLKLLAGEVIEVTVKDERVVVNHGTPQLYHLLPRDQVAAGCTKFYIVFEGRLPGVFGPDDDVQANVAHIPGARWARVHDYEDARCTFCDAVTVGFVKQVEYEVVRRVLSPVDFDLDWERV